RRGISHDKNEEEVALAARDSSGIGDEWTRERRVDFGRGSRLFAGERMAVPKNGPPAMAHQRWNLGSKLNSLWRENTETILTCCAFATKPIDNAVDEWVTDVRP